MSIAKPASSPFLQPSLSALIKLRGKALGLHLGGGKKAAAVLAGNRISPFRGRGIDFDEVRIYQAGDDIRNIDWRVTARTGKPHTKLFREERERPVFMVVDDGATMHFGTRRTFKSVVAAEAAAILAWAACAGGDRVGGLLFSAAEHREVRPASGQRGVLQLLKVLADGSAQGASARSGLASALNRLRRVARPGSLIFILSDFRQLDQEAERHLALLSRHNDLLPFFIYDPLERELPPPGRYNIVGEAGTFAIDTAKSSAREQYRQQFSHRLQSLSGLFRKQGVRLAELATDDDVAAVLRLTLAGRAGQSSSRAV